MTSHFHVRFHTCFPERLRIDSMTDPSREKNEGIFVLPVGVPYQSTNPMCHLGCSRICVDIHTLKARPLFLVKVTNGITWDKLLFLSLPVVGYILAQDAIGSRTFCCCKSFNGVHTVTDSLCMIDESWAPKQCDQMA